MWKVDLRAGSQEISHLQQLARCFDCALVAAPDDQHCLGGPAFDQVTSAEEMLRKVEHTLALLNGLARLERAEHRPAWFGKYIYRWQSGSYWERFPTGKPEVAPPSLSFESAPPGYHSSDAPTVKDSKYERRKRILSDPPLADILPAIADEITWQRLRVAFEKICALVSGSTSKGSWDNSMVKLRYASQDELKRFKENAEDPQHSGIDAVHGVYRSPSKYAKMTEREGFEFVVRLLNTYIAAP